MAVNTSSLARCDLCSELYVDPRMLPCLHTFCLKCLKTILAQQRRSGTTLRCPSCKKTAPLPKQGIDALPVDLRKSHEAEVALCAGKVQSGDKINCEQCVSVSNGPAISFCTNCGEFLCKACSEHHKTWRKTLNHELEPIDGCKSGAHLTTMPLVNSSHKPMSCQLHEDESLKFFCETCNTYVVIAWPLNTQATPMIAWRKLLRERKRNSHPP